MIEGVGLSPLFLHTVSDQNLDDVNYPYSKKIPSLLASIPSFLSTLLCIIFWATMLCFVMHVSKATLVKKCLLAQEFWLCLPDWFLSWEDRAWAQDYLEVCHFSWAMQHLTHPLCPQHIQKFEGSETITKWVTCEGWCLTQSTHYRNIHCAQDGLGPKMTCVDP